jgi:hypothetical protein
MTESLFQNSNFKKFSLGGIKYSGSRKYPT